MPEVEPTALRNALDATYVIKEALLSAAESGYCAAQAGMELLGAQPDLTMIYENLIEDLAAIKQGWPIGRWTLENEPEQKQATSAH